MTSKQSLQTVELEKFLTFAACVIRISGYVNSTTAKEKNVPSTGQIAWEWATKGRPDNYRNVNLLPEDRAMGAAVAKWMPEIKARHNDYLIRLAGIGKATVLSEREIGYASSAIPAWQKESAPVATENFLGKIGEKITVPVKFLEANGFDSAYGYCFAYRFEDEQGRKLSWLTSKNPSELNVTVGNQYLLTGTVKKHNSLGKKQETELTRAKIQR